MSGSATPALDIVVLGLSLRSSWGNGHATTYRALLRALAGRGHRVRFLERDLAWYDDNADPAAELPVQPEVYASLEELQDRFAGMVRDADLVVVGSFVPDGIAVGDWVQEQASGVTAFYDIDTPVTIARLARGDCDYLAARQVPRYDLYLSFTGGPTLALLEQRFGARRAEALYCAVDPAQYYPEPCEPAWDLGYMGTYSDDRQPLLERLLLQPARAWPGGRFVVAGPQYPDGIAWPANVARIEHLPPAGHRRFYNAQRFTLNLTRADMVAAGWAPSVRLFEAAACGVPIVSDRWPGLDQLFRPGEEILIAQGAGDVQGWLRGMNEGQRRRIGARGRARVLAEHTAVHRAETLERCVGRVARRRREGQARPIHPRPGMEVCHGSSA